MSPQKPTKTDPTIVWLEAIAKDMSQLRKHFRKRLDNHVEDEIISLQYVEKKMNDWKLEIVQDLADLKTSISENRLKLAFVVGGIAIVVPSLLSWVFYKFLS